MFPMLAMAMVGCGEKEKEPEYQSDKTYHWVLNEAGEVDKESKVKHTFEEDTSKKIEATCSTEGKKVEVCTVCKVEKETKIDKIDHTLSIDSSKSKAATCKEDGKTVEACSKCDYTKETAIPKLAHTFDGNGTVKSDGERSYIEYECTTCHEKSTNAIKFGDYASAVGFADGKCSTDADGLVTWNVNLPAGQYDVYFVAKYSSSGEGKTLSERGVAVTYNDQSVSFDSTLDNVALGMSTEEMREFSFCTITATGGMDKLTLANRYYRFVFDVDAYITFKPAMAS